MDLEELQQFRPTGMEHMNVSSTSMNYENANATETGGRWFLAFVNVYYGIIYLVGMCGNALVLYVVCRYSKMHTVTNFFILSLALADLCFLINLPFLMVTTYYGSWKFGDLYCKIFYSMTTVNQFASSFFLMVMSADRYFAVCHPIRSNKFRTAHAAIIVCVVIWVASVGLMAPVFLYAGKHDNGPCAIHWPGVKDGVQAFTLYCFVLGFSFPLVLILAFYAMVLRKLKTMDDKSLTQNEARRKSHRRVTVVVLAVITAYLICWLPYWIFQLILVFANSDLPQPGPSVTSPEVEVAPYSEDFAKPLPNSVYIMSLFQCLCYTNSAVNPVLYAMLSENFKKSFLTACVCGRRGEFERTGQPEPSVYRSRGTSLRKRKTLAIEDEEEEEESPEPIILADAKTEVSSFLRTPDMRKVTQRLDTNLCYQNGENEKEEALL